MIHSFKRYHMGDTTITANNDVSFGIEKGELAIILGASGAFPAQLSGGEQQRAAIAPIADRVIHMHDVRVKSIETNEHPMDIENLEW